MTEAARCSELRHCPPRAASLLVTCHSPLPEPDKQYGRRPTRAALRSAAASPDPSHPRPRVLSRVSHVTVSLETRAASRRALTDDMENDLVTNDNATRPSRAKHGPIIAGACATRA